MIGRSVVHIRHGHRSSRLQRRANRTVIAKPAAVLVLHVIILFAAGIIEGLLRCEENRSYSHFSLSLNTFS